MNRINRRSLLTAGLGITAAGMTSSLVTGCSQTGSGTSKNTGAAGGSPVPTPVYQPASGPKPDIVGTADIPDTFFSYPAEPTVSVTTKPGDGKPITILTQTYTAVTPQGS